MNVVEGTRNGSVVGATPSRRDGGRADMGIVDRIGTGWRADAACVGKPTDWWFAVSRKTSDGQQAVKICAACPVRKKCLAWALQFQPHDLDGIWAGTTQRERVRLRAKQRAGRIGNEEASRG